MDIHVVYKPEKNRICFYDGYLCHRAPSVFDGDFDCFETVLHLGSWSDQGEIVHPRCPRLVVGV